MVGERFKARLICHISAVLNSIKQIKFDGNLTPESAAAFLQIIGPHSTGLVTLSDRNAAPIQMLNFYLSARSKTSSNLYFSK